MVVRVQLDQGADRPIAWSAIREELHIEEPFSPDALGEAARPGPEAPLPQLPMEFFTVDPPASMDLDQAMFLERSATGYTVNYALADVATFVSPGGALDRTTHERGETFYSPDKSVPLLPPSLSEGVASLLPDVWRPAIVWKIELDQQGQQIQATVVRASIRSVRKLDYAAVQQAVDRSDDEPQFELLKEIGEKRRLLAQNRGAIDLGTAEQVVTMSDGRAVLSYRASLEVERWNEQISLLTGIAAAQLMVNARIGILRTLPPADEHTITSLRRSAVTLGVVWPDDAAPNEVIAALDSTNPAHIAFLTVATKLLRGAAYSAFDGDLPGQLQHAGVASVYAHCTAPMRRLVDRYVNEICVCLCANQPIPDWVHAALPKLPAEMATADHKAHALDRAIVDAAEAMLLSSRVGQVFEGVVVETDTKGAVVQMLEPAVRARSTGLQNQLGRRVRVRLIKVDIERRTVEFEPAE